MAIAKLHLKYTVLDVFTTSAWAQGNPLAVVQLTMEAASQINQEQKQFIAREFNFSETTFLHNYSAAAVKEEESKIRVDIFTKTTEVPFAGHPTIGTAFYCFEHVFHGDSEGGVLITKAGDIPIRRDSTGLIGADVPCHNYRVHSQGPGTVTGKSVIDQHPELQDVSGSLPLDFQVISIAKGLL